MASQPNGSIGTVPDLIMVGGAPASGKSQLSQQLALRYLAPLCAKDAFKEILFGTLGSGEGLGAGRVDWSRSLSNASFALMFHLADVLLQAQVPRVLLDGNFRPGEHEGPVQALLARSGARLIQILCRASPATRAARLAARAGDAARHRAHHDERIDAALPTPGFLELPGERLTFDTDATPASPRQDLQQLHDLQRRLDALVSQVSRGRSP
jgi:predicted kinase